jgi:hypothetical protein
MAFTKGFLPHNKRCTAFSESNGSVEGSQATNLKPILKRKIPRISRDFFVYMA